MSALPHRLASPWVYLAIRDRAAQQWKLNWLLPLAFSAAVCAILCAFDGLAGTLSIALLKCLASCNPQLFFFPGFFLTALAAVAVFEKKSLDMPMPGGSMTVSIRGTDGVRRERVLTRRLFLSLALSFLTAQSFLFCLGLHLISCFGSAVMRAFAESGPWLVRLAPPIVLFVVLAAFAQILLNMLLCLYYLGERLPSHCDPEPDSGMDAGLGRS